MKSLVTEDKRLACQLVVLLLLTGLPVSMIAVNGVRAIRGIINRLEEQGHNSAHRPVDGDGKDILFETFDTMRPDKKNAKAALFQKVLVPQTQEEDVRGDSQGLQFGIFDPGNTFANEQSLHLRHVYVSWASYDQPQLREKLLNLQQCGLQVMLTIEPWPQEGSGLTLLDGIVAGKYDTIMDELSEVLNELSGPVYISWGHEMDQDLTERYPWSGQDPARFVASYRYVTDYFRRHVRTQLRWVWAGVLKQGSLRYWPGEAYVDFIGMPVYSFPVWDQQYHGYIRDFQSTFEEKRDVVAGLGKPLMITELGVSGSADFEAFWLHQAFQQLGQYPDLKVVMFFHALDVEGAWGRNLPTPDWRVQPGVILGLVQWHLAQSVSSDPISNQAESAELVEKEGDEK